MESQACESCVWRRQKATYFVIEKATVELLSFWVSPNFSNFSCLDLTVSFQVLSVSHGLPVCFDDLMNRHTGPYLPYLPSTCCGNCGNRLPPPCSPDRGWGLMYLCRTWLQRWQVRRYWGRINQKQRGLATDRRHASGLSSLGVI